jgi:hypothetical protein
MNRQDGRPAGGQLLAENNSAHSGPRRESLVVGKLP